MASSSSSSSYSSSSRIGAGLEDLTCSVCLELFKEPVTLTCGHSFCCACMENYWKSGEATAFACPNCREVFPQKPKLKKSVILASLVDQIKLRKGEVTFGVDIQDLEHDTLTDKDVNSGDDKSYCEVCDRKASKRCVPCEIMCCERHVKPHQEKGHTLVEPGMNVEELRCTNHGKPIQLYCKDDESFLCLMCMAGEHRDHEYVPLEIAHTELKVCKCKHCFVCTVVHHIHTLCQIRKS